MGRSSARQPGTVSEPKLHGRMHAASWTYGVHSPGAPLIVADRRRTCLVGLLRDRSVRCVRSSR